MTALYFRPFAAACNHGEPNKRKEIGARPGSGRSRSGRAGCGIRFTTEGEVMSGP